MKNSSQNETLIRQIIEDWAKAVRYRDMGGIMANHAANIVMFDVPELFQSTGIDPYCKTWGIFFRHTKPGVFDIQ